VGSFCLEAIFLSRNFLPYTYCFSNDNYRDKKNKNYIMMLFLIFPSIFEAAYDLIEYLLVLLNQQGFLIDNP
jgi:hypothetical protein